MGKTVKKTGEVYTPEFIVDKMLDIVNYKNKTILKKHIIDNSCGEGAFLIQVVKRYIIAAQRMNYSNTEIKNDLEKYIHGIELNSESHLKTITNLNNVLKTYNIKNKVKWDILNEDTLLVKKYNQKMDFVVGNPPYIRIHSLDFDYKQFEFSKKGMTDLYLIFFEIGINMLNNEGKLVYVTPNSFLTSMAGKAFREKLIEDNLIEKVLNLGQNNPFPQITTYPIITMLNKEKKNTDVWVYDNNYKKNYLISNNDFVVDGNFYFTFSSNIDFLNAILNHQTLRRRVFVRNGLATNADSFFYNDNHNGAFTIDAIKASKGTTTKLFFPYNREGEILHLNTIAQLNPTIYEKLLESKKTLMDRSLDNNDNWYGFARSQAIKDVVRDKITVNSIIKSIETIKINFAPSGTAVYSGLFVYSDEVPLEEIEQRIKSTEFIEYIKLLGKDKSGQYYYVSSTDLQKYLDYCFDQVEENYENEERRVNNEQLRTRSN